MIPSEEFEDPTDDVIPEWWISEILDLARNLITGDEVFLLTYSNGEIAAYHDQEEPVEREALSHQISQLGNEIDICWDSDKVDLMKLELRYILRSLEGLLKSHVETREDSSIEIASDDKSICDEEATKVHEQTWGRQRIDEWKANAGKAKDWRTYSVLKISTKRKEQSRTRRKLDIRKNSLALFPCSPNFDMPATALKSHNAGLRNSLKPENSSRECFQLHTKRMQHEKTNSSIVLTGDGTGDSYNDDRDDVERVRQKKHLTSPSWLEEANNIRSQWHTTRSLRKTAGLEQSDWPLILHRSGEMIRYPYRLIKHLRTEPHGEVYVLEDLDSGKSYEAKVYTLRGIHLSQRKRRVDNLKRMTALPSFVLSFEYGGRKYCLFEPMEEEMATPPAKLGAFGRRNTPEYRKAFPKLPLPEPVRLERQAALRLQISATWKDAISDTTTRQLLSEIEVGLLGESMSNDNRWQKFDSPLPPVLRVLVLLGERNGAWKVRGNALLRQVVLLHLGSMPQEEGRKGRRNKASKAAWCKV